jgi:chitinase
MTGAMFWTINDDRRHGYNYSNTVGPQLHSFSKVK